VPKSLQAGLLFLRALFRYGGIAFGFMAINLTSLANSQVASQMTPVWSALLGRACLGEPWEQAEVLATAASVIGVCLVFQPAFLFGADPSHDNFSAAGGGAGAVSSSSGNDDAAFAAALAANATDATTPLAPTLAASSSAASSSASDDALGVLFALLGSLCAAGAYVLIRLSGTLAAAPMPFPKLMLAQALGQFLWSGPSLWATHQVALSLYPVANTQSMRAQGLLGDATQRTNDATSLPFVFVFIGAPVAAACASFAGTGVG
jgi:drug/metabolite transporter (DMT)-like permease